MPCLWSTYYRSLQLPIFRSTRHFTSSQWLSTQPTRRVAAALALKQIPPTSNFISATTTTLTDAQASLAASQAVRLSCSNGQYRNAYFILNSLNNPLTTTPSTLTIPRKVSLTLQSVTRDRTALDISKPIKHRLAAHTLLHSHLRAGQLKESSRLLENMLKAGIQIRANTLDTHLRLLSKVPAPIPSSLDFRSGKLMAAASPTSLLYLTQRSARSQSTQFAIKLLEAAQRYGHQRTEKMYARLIAACILNGEIIVASLLFGVLVREWQAKLILANAPDDQSAAAIQTSSQASRIHTKPIYPNPLLMRSIVKTIQDGIAEQDPNTANPKSVKDALQALANLAVLLDERKLPFPAIAPLVHALMHCPKVDEEVWIIWKGTPRRVSAYSYFHSVLKRLVQDLPTSKVQGAGESVLPPLSLASYNTLLHYAYRSRRSPEMADRVFRHMTEQRNPPLKPDVVTYNIMLRSGTLLRNQELTEFALTRLRELSAEKATTEATSSAAKAVAVEVASKALHETELGTSQPNSYTTTSFVTHLVSTNRADEVAQVIFDIIPELCTPSSDIPVGQSSPANREIMSKSYSQLIDRAVALGPWFFTSVLNALEKSGRTGLAERIWCLAKAAEKASWAPERYPGTEPWCLPVHAYTSIMKCYASEARKRRKVVGRHESDGTFADHLKEALYSRENSKEYVRGWAPTVAKRSTRVPKRNPTARVMGSKLFNEMQATVQDVCHRLAQQQTSAQASAHIPHPDARFFNAALDTFTHRPHMRPRAPRARRRHWRRQLQTSTRYYACFGIKSQNWSPELEQVAQCMHDYGYGLPVGVQKMAIGNWTPSTVPAALESPRSAVHEREGRAGKETGYGTVRPYSLSTVKTRGVHRRR